jgi:hypothetical protein
MVPPPQKIVWLYKGWQPLYDEISRTVVPRQVFLLFFFLLLLCRFLLLFIFLLLDPCSQYVGAQT